MSRLDPIRLLSALALMATLAACGAGGADEPVLIGVAGPMAQASGQSMLRAAEMAVDSVNRAGGVRGRALAIAARDDDADPGRAIAIAQELRDDRRVLAVVGHINSSATLAAAPIYNDPANGVVELSPASSSPLITEAGPWTFRLCPSDLQHGAALARWALGALDARTATVLYANDAYGRGVLRTFAAAYQAEGGRFLGGDPFLPETLDAGDELDLYLERGLRRGMQALVVAGQAEQAGTIIAAARRLGYDGHVLGPDGVTGLREAGDVARGVYISSAFLPDRDTPEARAFVHAYRERYGGEPDHRAAMAYDAVLLLARGLEAAGIDRSALRDWLAGVGTETPAWDGVSGRVAFDANGDVAGREVTIGVVRDGALITARRDGGTAAARVAATD